MASGAERLMPIDFTAVTRSKCIAGAAALMLLGAALLHFPSEAVHRQGKAMLLRAPHHVAAAQHRVLDMRRQDDEIVRIKRGKFQWLWRVAWRKRSGGFGPRSVSAASGAKCNSAVYAARRSTMAPQRPSFSSRRSKPRSR